MMIEWLKGFTPGDIVTVLGAALGFAGTIGGVLWVILRKWITRENRKNIGIAFNETVKGLAADKMELRLASAIVMRRFLDEGTEYGVGGAPFAKTAVSVISAVLKHASTSDFQKVLADSLVHAPAHCLLMGDFQRANLSKAYLGKVNLEGADFFQANLSGASLKGALLSKAIFREATLNRTVFIDADLQGANFEMATLQSIKFSGADLRGATFKGATLREVDFTGAKLDGAVFTSATGYGNVGVDEANSAMNQGSQGKQIFFSRPGQLDSRQLMFVDSTKAILKNKGFNFLELERNCYDSTDVLSNLRNTINECSAMIAFGFQAIIVNDGLFRFSTDDSRNLSNVHLSTPWNHVEMPLLLKPQFAVAA